MQLQSQRGRDGTASDDSGPQVAEGRGVHESRGTVNIPFSTRKSREKEIQNTYPRETRSSSAKNMVGTPYKTVAPYRSIAFNVASALKLSDGSSKAEPP
jgi:hypothetical protein